MLLRGELFSFTGLGGSASRCHLRLFLLATSKPGARITADVSWHAPEPGNIFVENYGEKPGLAYALARSGAFTPQREVLGGMMVEMKVIHPALKTHLHRHKQGREQSRGFNTGGNRKREGSGHKL